MYFGFTKYQYRVRIVFRMEVSKTTGPLLLGVLVFKDCSVSGVCIWEPLCWTPQMASKFDSILHPRGKR